MTDEYRLFVRDCAISAEQALYNLRNAVGGMSGLPYSENEWDRKAASIEGMRIDVAHLVYTLEHQEEG